MTIVETLNTTLLKNRAQDKICRMDPEMYKNIAAAYTKTENSIAVLSDMQINTSYIFASATATGLGLDFPEDPLVINSIWEEEILMKIHPDDRMKKYVHELRFFRLQEKNLQEDRSAFCVVSKMRLLDRNGIYQWIRHRMFYFYSPYNGKLRFALCLYDRIADHLQSMLPEFLIVNTVKGEVVAEDKFDYRAILSKRELEVLKYIGEGFTSKEIADFLSISFNTVSRHRQNILKKLNVKNSVEAFTEALQNRLMSHNK